MELQDLVGSGHYAELDLDDLDVAGSPGSCSFCPFSTMCAIPLNTTTSHDTSSPRP